MATVRRYIGDGVYLLTRPEPKPGAAKVYFIQSGKGGPIKIGTTAYSVASRMARLQTGSFDTLRLLGTIPGYFDVERQLHERFARVRMRTRGEWFRPCQELLEFICAEAEKGEAVACHG